MLPATPAAVPADKATLVAMLRQASELEHALCCQYLYAAFTLKRGGDPGLTAAQASLTAQWQQQITKVAVQEMYHLMLASNLLTAIDCEPHLWRPNFPQPRTRYSDVDLPSLLAPFDLETVTRFMCWEKPEQAGWWDEACKRCQERVHARLGLAAAPEPPPYDSIGQLYQLIDEGLRLHPEWIVPETAPRQVTSELVPFSPAVAPITSVEDASGYIHVIVVEGEGTPDWDSKSHFAYYHQIVDQLGQLARADAGFAAAWPTVENPIYDPRHEKPGTEPIADPSVQPIGRLFSDLYLLLMRLLVRLFIPDGESPAERRTLANAAMALMPLAIKPLGILLTRLPAGPDHPGQHAGPSFELPPAIEPPIGAREEALPGLRDELLRVTRRCRLLSIETTRLPGEALAELAAIAARLETLAPLFELERPELVP